MQSQRSKPPSGPEPLWPVLLTLALFIATSFSTNGVLALLLAASFLYLIVQTRDLAMRNRQLEERLARLEGELPAPVPPSAAPAPELTAPTAGGAPGAPPRPVPQAPPRTVPQAPPRPAPQPATRPLPAPQPSYDWEAAWRRLAGPLAGGGRPTSVGTAEARIGIVWFSRIGILLILISAIAGYTLLQNTGVQAALGWLAGLGFLGLGWWSRRKGYGPWSQAVTGGGIGLLYLVTTAAATIMEPAVISIPIAFGLMIAITAGAALLAVFMNSIAVGILSMIGGFATPFLLSSGQGDYRVLFAYMVILNLGLLLVAWFKRWPVYNYLLFLTTWLIYGGWRGSAYTPAESGGAFLFATLFFVIFAAVSIQYNVLHRTPTRYQDLGLVVINGFVYFGSGLDLLPPGAVRAAFAFGMALLYLGLGYLTLRRNRADRMLQLSFLGLAAIFLTLAFPVALGGPWLTVAWALEAAALVWIGFLVQGPEAVWGGLLLFAVTAFRLIWIETFPGWYGEPLPGAGLRAFTFLVSIGACYLAVWAHSRFQGDRRAMGALAALASLLSLWYLTWEITLAFDTRSGGAALIHQTLAIAGAWALYGLVLGLAEARFSHSLMRNGARLILTGSLALLLAGIAMDSNQVAQPLYRFGGYAAVGGAIWLAEWLFRRRAPGDRMGGLLSLAAALAGYGLGAREVSYFMQAQWPTAAFRPAPAQSSTQLFLTLIVGAIYAVGAMGAALWLRSRPARVMAAALVMLTLLLLAMASLNLHAEPAIRLIAFCAVVPGALLAARLGLLAGPDQPEAPFLAALPLGAALVTGLWGVAELHHGLPGAIAPFASLLWGGLYGTAIAGAGIWLRSHPARLLGLALVGLSALQAPLIAATAGGVHWLLRAGAYAASTGGLYAIAWLVRRFRSRTGRADLRATEWAALAGALLTVGWLSAEVYNLTPSGATVRDFLLSTAWGGYGFTLLAAGFLLRHRWTRLMAIGLVALTILKIVLHDMWNLEVIWRFWIGAGVGGMMVVASLAYQRWVRLIVGDEQGEQGEQGQHGEQGQ